MRTKHVMCMDVHLIDFLISILMCIVKYWSGLSILTQNNDFPMRSCHVLCSHSIRPTCIRRGNYILAHIKMKHRALYNNVMSQFCWLWGTASLDILFSINKPFAAKHRVSTSCISDLCRSLMVTMSNNKSLGYLVHLNSKIMMYLD